MSTLAVDPRRRARELAMQALYCWDLCRCPAGDIELPIDILAEAPTGAWEIARELIAGVRARCQPIDAALDQRLRNWDLDRLAAVDRSILRLAAFEILYRAEVSPRVAITEAIELAKRYGSDEKTTRLVNGVLDRLARDHRPQEMRRDSPSHRARHNAG